MLVRASVVALTAAVLVPLSGGTASASCLDDLLADWGDGYTESPKSEYWGTPRGFGAYVDHTGTANIAVHGDALIGDAASWLTVDWPAWVVTHAQNTPGVTVEFVECVAG